jgi:hypothetical protein
VSQHDDRHDGRNDQMHFIKICSRCERVVFKCPCPGPKSVITVHGCKKCEKQ